MRRLIGVAALTAVLALTVTAGIAPAHGGKRHGKGTTFKVWATTVQQSFLDLNGPGPTLGDRIVFSDDLSRRRGGKVIGFDGGECVIVRLEEPSYSFIAQCVATVWLRSGQITAQGLVNFADGQPDERITLAITGGTRRFKGAGGEVKVRFLSEVEARLVFHLQREGKRHRKRHR